MNFLQILSGKKTYLTAVAIIVLLFGQWQAWWKIDPTVYTALTAAAIAFLRAGVAKGPGSVAPQPAANQGLKLPPALMLSFACMIAVLGTGIFFAGCTTTADRIAYQAAGTTSVSVDTAMRLWGTYVAQSHPSVSREQTVAEAYAKYQAAMAAVCDAGVVYSSAAGSTNAPAASLAMQSAVANASQEILDLENLITSFGVKLQSTNSTSTP